MARFCVNKFHQKANKGATPSASGVCVSVTAGESLKGKRRTSPEEVEERGGRNSKLASAELLQRSVAADGGFSHPN